MRSWHCLSFWLGLAAAAGPAGLRGVAQPYFINPGDIVIANYDKGSVVRIDSATGGQQRLGGVFAVPTDVALHPDGFVYVSELQGRVKRLDLADGTITTVLAAGSGPSQVWGITVGPSGELFVTSRADHAVYRVNPTNGVANLLTQGNLLYTPIGIDLLDANHLVVACLLTNRLVTVSLSAPAQATLAEGGALDQPWGVAVGGGTVYAAAYDGKALVRVAGGVVLPVTPLADFPYGLGIDPGNNPVVGLMGVAGSVVRVSPQGALLSSYSGSLIGQVTGLEVARSRLPPPTDTDGDGMADWEEAVAGTDPRAADSVLRVGASAGAGGVLRLEWPAVAGRVYSVLATNDAAARLGVLTNGLAATPPTNTWTSPSPPGPPRFFRIGVERLP